MENKFLIDYNPYISEIASETYTAVEMDIFLQFSHLCMGYDVIVYKVSCYFLT